jgi:hypothetical protein
VPIFIGSGAPLYGGEFNGRRYLSKKTVEFMLSKELTMEKYLHEQNLKLYRTRAITNDGDWAQAPLCVRYAELLRLRQAVLKIELEESSRDSRIDLTNA